PAVDLTQPALAVDVLGVLAAVALRGGICDFLRDPWALDRPQLLELGAQLLRTLGRDVARELRRRWSVPRRHSTEHIRYADAGHGLVALDRGRAVDAHRA